MFFEMFAASALATLIFQKEGDKTSVDFSSVNGRLDQIIDTQNFMKARLALMEFNTKLIGVPNLSFDMHSIEAIMKAAAEGFNKLLETAVSDEHNFLNARTLFNNTYGNRDWVEKQFGSKVAIIEKFVMQYNLKKHELVELSQLKAEFSEIDKELRETHKIRFFKRRRLNKKIDLIKERLGNRDVSIFDDPLIKFHEYREFEDEWNAIYDAHNRYWSEQFLYEAIESSKLL